MWAGQVRIGVVPPVLADWLSLRDSRKKVLFTPMARPIAGGVAKRLLLVKSYGLMERINQGGSVLIVRHKSKRGLGRMAKYHIHIYETVKMYQADIEASDAKEAQQKALALLKEKALKESESCDCSYIALAWQEDPQEPGPKKWRLVDD